LPGPRSIVKLRMIAAAMTTAPIAPMIQYFLTPVT